MRKLWIGLIGLIFVSGLVFAQTPTEKTAEQITNLAREMLLHQIEKIQEFVRTVGEKSGRVSGLDMSLIKKRIENFFSLRRKLLEKVGAPFSIFTEKDVSEIAFVFGTPFSIFTEKDVSEIAFVFECQKMINVYFAEGGLNYQDDKLQGVKEFFSKYAGREMIIEKAKDWVARIILGFFASVLLMALIVMAFSKKNHAIAIRVGVIVFIICMLLYLFVF